MYLLTFSPTQLEWFIHFRDISPCEAYRVFNRHRMDDYDDAGSYGQLGTEPYGNDDDKENDEVLIDDHNGDARNFYS